MTRPAHGRTRRRQVFRPLALLVAGSLTAATVASCRSGSDATPPEAAPAAPGPTTTTSTLVRGESTTTTAPATPGESTTTSPVRSGTSTPPTSRTTTTTRPPAPAPPVVGAIRWDAWHGPLSPAGEAVERSLGPSHWHCRLPFFGRVTSPDTVTVRGNTQSTVDREIDLASTAGLDYWAFAFYPGTEPQKWRENPLNFGLDLYLQSARRGALDFSVLLAQVGPTDKWRSHTVPELIRLLRRSEYQTVAGGRPLVYVLPNLVQRFESVTAARAALTDLRTAARAAGVRDPYLATMVHDPALGRRDVASVGFDAISAYAVVGDSEHREHSHAELRTATREFWDATAATGKPVVPLVSAGWDPRPRWEHPVPWDPDPVEAAWYRAPTPAQLADSMRSALTWESAHPTATPADALLVYAWNEFDEGGWLAPTLTEGSGRLDALAPLLGGRASGVRGTGTPCSALR